MDEKELRRVIEQYFQLGYENQVILAFLNSRHGITMSLATLKQRFRDYGLSSSYIEVDDQQLREVVQRKISGPGNFVAIEQCGTPYELIITSMFLGIGLQIFFES